MIQLYSMTWIVALFFAVIGGLRGLNKEIVSLSGIVLALFALFQLDSILRGFLLASVPADQVFFVQVGLFGLIIYYAYRTRSSGLPGGARRGRLQDIILGCLLGALNGYLIWGAVWYFLDINDYPLSPLIIAPAPNSSSAQNLNLLPLVLIGGVAGSSTEFLTIGVIIVFLLVLLV
jgi:hypothetical protein